MPDQSACQITGHCSQLGRISKLEAQHDHVITALVKLDGKMDQILLMLGRVEVLENKHLTQNEALSRAFARIEGAERKLDETTRSLNDLLGQIKGMTRAAVVLWTVMGGAVTYALVTLMGLQ